MRKSYAYLLFAVFLMFSACQEDPIVNEVSVESEGTRATYTFIYENKEYVGSSINDIPPLVAKANHPHYNNTHLAVYLDDKSANTFHVYSTEEELRSKHFKTNEANAHNARENNSGCFMRGTITMFHDKYFKNFGVAGFPAQKDRVIVTYDENSVSPLFNRPYAEIRHFNSVKNDGGQTINFDNKLSSLVLNVFGGTPSLCQRDALISVTLYDLPYHSLSGGASLLLASRHTPGYGGSIAIDDLSIFKISNNTFPLSSGDWDNKASSLRTFLRYD